MIGRLAIFEIVTFGCRKPKRRRTPNVSRPGESTLPSWTVVELAKEEVRQSSCEIQSGRPGQMRIENTARPEQQGFCAISTKELQS